MAENHAQGPETAVIGAGEIASKIAWIELESGLKRIPNEVWTAAKLLLRNYVDLSDL